MQERFGKVGRRRKGRHRSHSQDKGFRIETSEMPVPRSHTVAHVSHDAGPGLVHRNTITSVKIKKYGIDPTSDLSQHSGKDSATNSRRGPPSQLTLTGVYTSVRFYFAFLRDFECNGDITSIDLLDFEAE